MPNPRKRSQSTRKQLTEKQLGIAQRSRSIKASLLRILSTDAAALYHMDSGGRNISKLRGKEQVKQIIEDQAASNKQENREEIICPPLPENAEKPSLPAQVNPSQPAEQRHSTPQVDRSQEELIMPLISRLIAFFMGLLIHYVIHSYFSNQSLALSSSAIAISAVSVLVTVILMPWNRKLLWNLCSLFMGLLFAIIAL